MGLAVVTVAKGGLPVVDVTSIMPFTGLPVEEATNGRGIPVTKVPGGGLPVMFIGGGVPVGPVGPASGSWLITAFTPGGDRNDFDGEVGLRLGIGGADVPVTWIGLRCNTGNSGTRKVNLYEWFAHALVRTVTIDLTGAVAGETVWKSIPPTTLLANGYYALLMEVSSGMQPWANAGPCTARSDLVANLYSVYATPVGGAFGTGGPDSAYVGLNLGWGSAKATDGGGLPMVVSDITSDVETVPPDMPTFHREIIEPPRSRLRRWYEALVSTLRGLRTRAASW